MTNPNYLPSRSSKYKQRINIAVKQAKDAIDLPLLERLRKYSFVTRYVKSLKTPTRKYKGSKNEKENEPPTLKNSNFEDYKKNNVIKKFRRIHYSIMSNESEVSVVLKEVDWNNVENLDLSLLVD